jgi:hypothetical protein
MFMSSSDEPKRWGLDSARHVGSVNDTMTSKLPPKLIHPSIPPAPDPVKLDSNLSPLGGETTPITSKCSSELNSKFSSKLNSNAMDWDLSVKRSSDTVDQNELWQVLQCQVVLAASDRRNTLMEWLVNMSVFLESPNYLCDPDVMCTYKEVFNMVHWENEYYNVAMNHYHGEPLDQVISVWHMIIDSVVRLSQNYIPRPLIKMVPRIAPIDYKSYNKMSINPSVPMILCHCKLALRSWHPKKPPTTPFHLEPSGILRIKLSINGRH